MPTPKSGASISSKRNAVLISISLGMQATNNGGYIFHSLLILTKAELSPFDLKLKIDWRDIPHLAKREKKKKRKHGCGITAAGTLDPQNIIKGWEPEALENYHRTGPEDALLATTKVLSIIVILVENRQATCMNADTTDLWMGFIINSTHSQSLKHHASEEKGRQEGRDEHQLEGTSF